MVCCEVLRARHGRRPAPAPTGESGAPPLADLRPFVPAERADGLLRPHESAPAAAPLPPPAPVHGPRGVHVAAPAASEAGPPPPPAPHAPAASVFQRRRLPVRGPPGRGGVRGRHQLAGALPGVAAGTASMPQRLGKGATRTRRQGKRMNDTLVLTVTN